MWSEEVDLEVVRLVVRRNLNKKKKNASDEALVNDLTNLTHCRLDRENLSSVPLLNFLPCLTNLYLQCNQITEIPDMSHLTQLRFLTLAENLITEVKGLKCLEKLGLLDLTDNRIAVLDCSELPKSIIILNVAENPCADSPGIRDGLLLNLPDLKSLDGELVESLTSSEEEEEDSDSDYAEDVDIEKPVDMMRSDDKDEVGTGFDDFRSEMVQSFEKFSFAISENEKELQKDFDEFTSALPSPTSPQDNVLGSQISEQELCKLEKEAADIRDLPRLDTGKKFLPQPPSGAKNASRPRNKASSKKVAVTRVRTPGARPFQRVIK